MGREEGKEEQGHFYFLVVFHSGFAMFGQGFEVESLSFSVGSAEKPCWASLLLGSVAPSPQSWSCLSQPVSPAGFTF